MQVQSISRVRCRFPVFVLLGGLVLPALSACHRTTPADVVATVNGKEISRSDLDRFYQQSLGDSPQNGTGQVGVFPANLGCSGPAKVLQGSNTTLQLVQSVAVDQAGYVYVSNAGAVGYFSQQYGAETCAFNQIAVFAPLQAGTQNAAPLATITDPVLPSVASCEAAQNTTSNDHLAIALDTRGNIYAASYLGNEVFVYPARTGSSLSATPLAKLKPLATMRVTPVAGSYSRMRPVDACSTMSSTAASNVPPHFAGANRASAKAPRLAASHGHGPGSPPGG